MISNKIDASPSKEFFIDMLTRDIPVTDCILDLVDNSIDSVLRFHNINTIELFEDGYIASEEKKFRNIIIDITITSQEFKITDNCFGIGVDTAQKYAFRFGTADGAILSKSGLSVYGIGMKRAFFKIGKYIEVKSSTHEESFTMNIDVEEWAKDPETWQFNFKDVNRDQENQVTGTQIVINSLNDPIKKRFGDDQYLTEIKNKISRTYTLFIDGGLQININGSVLRSELPAIKTSDELPIARKKIEINEETDKVEILILAGIGDVSTKGWFVFCNGRLILSGNTDGKTGWGSDFPLFHNKYNLFTGLILFNSQNVELLPWTTTKEDVEIDSDIYKTAITTAKILARPVLTFINNAYPDKKDSAEDDEIIERKVANSAKPLSISNIPKKETAFTFHKEPSPKKETSIISYHRKNSEIESIKLHLGNKRLSNREIGDLTFEYYLEMEGIDE